MAFLLAELFSLKNPTPPLSLLQQAHRPETDDFDYGFRSRTAKPCRACNDFQSWVKSNRQQNAPTQNFPEGNDLAKIRKECPLDKDELGRNSWSVFHTIAAYYPDKPSDDDRRSMSQFIHGVARFYPCESCRKDFQNDIKDLPPQTESRQALSRWWCQIHNRVNRKLGKPEFDCDRLDQRWLDGWPDGSCN